MISDAVEQFVLLQVSGDHLRASLRTVPCAQTQSLTTEDILSICSSREIAQASIDLDAIDSLLSHIKTQQPLQPEHALAAISQASQETVQAVIAQGTPKINGEHGYFLLEPELGAKVDQVAAAKAARAARARGLADRDDIENGAADPGNSGASAGGANSAHAATPDVDNNDAVDHYNTMAFVIVEKGDVLGSIVPPTAGTDGADVFGASITAVHGRKAELDSDDSIHIRQDGTVVARKRGRLIAKPGILHIETQLRIDGNVDFSTGNVTFPGDVTVSDGIKDRFRLECDGTATVCRLVEAATIKALLDVDLLTGAAGRGMATIHARRDLKAGYLDAVNARAGRDCIIHREITGCTLYAGRAVVIPNGIVRSGSVVCGVSCDAGVIGAAGGTVTRVAVGRPEDVSELLARLACAESVAMRAVTEADDKLSAFPRGTKLTASQAETLCELEFEAASARTMLEPVTKAIASLRSLRDKLPLPWVSARKMIYAGTVIDLGPYTLAVKRDIKGPIRIELPAAGVPIARDTGTGQTRPAKELMSVEANPDMIDLRSDTLVPAA